MSNNSFESHGSRSRVRFILIDRHGPLAEFETWEEALRHMSINHVQGGSIVRSEEPIDERSWPIDCINDINDRVRDAANSRGQTGMPALTYTAIREGLMPMADQTAKVTGKVLVIEEDVFMLLSIAQMVKAAGHEVVIARDAAEGMEAVRSERPDLILVDVDPGPTAFAGRWNGFQLLEWWSRHYPRGQTKLVLMASGDPEKLKPRAAAVGACACVAKPIVKESLLAEIRRAMGGRSGLERVEVPRPRPS
jgi:CheY-like chemotaxis protein